MWGEAYPFRGTLYDQWILNDSGEGKTEISLQIVAWSTVDWELVREPREAVVNLIILCYMSSMWQNHGMTSNNVHLTTYNS